MSAINFIWMFHLLTNMLKKIGNCVSQSYLSALTCALMPFIKQKDVWMFLISVFMHNLHNQYKISAEESIYRGWVSSMFISYRFFLASVS